MKVNAQKFKSTCIALVFSLLFINASLAGRCTGNDYCTACKTCEHCKHCAIEGGSCGICKSHKAVKEEYQDNDYAIPQKPLHIDEKAFAQRLRERLEKTSSPVEETAVDNKSVKKNQDENWNVYFSPHGGCTEAIVNALKKAESSIHIQAYSFTSQAIAQALVDAHKRGVQVFAILDRSQKSEYSTVDFIRQAGIPVLIDAKHAIAHNKVIVIDDKIVITGSFNFTNAAEDKNAENLLIIHDPILVTEYTKNWEAHREHSDLYQTNHKND